MIRKARARWRALGEERRTMAESYVHVATVTPRGTVHHVASTGVAALD
jgi:hypothetical protein